MERRCRTCDIIILGSLNGDYTNYFGYCMKCYNNHICLFCKKPKVPIGTDRANGKRIHSDWDSRMYHKKCWKLIQR